MKTILVPIDFSDAMPLVLERAAETARAFGTDVVLLHVSAPEPDFVGYDAGPDTVRDAVAHELHGEHHQLEAAEAMLAGLGVQSKALQVQGPTVDKILQEAERLGAGMIVMGSHGHGALYELLAGSVTEGVLRKTALPVLIVPVRSAKS